VSLKPLRTSLEAWSPARGVAPDPLHAIAAAWPALVGVNVAANAAPRQIAGKTLIIATKSSVWSQQLQFLSPRILDAVQSIAQGAGIERLAFRTGTLYGVRAPGTGAKARPAAGARRPPGPRGSAAGPPGEARDLAEALQRLRRRLGAIRRGRVLCQGCAAPLEGGEARLCAPCSGADERRRLETLQRLLYAAPWLSLEELRDQVPNLSQAEFERARRQLLNRWWIVLERVRRSGRVSSTRLERQLASSYVLLQSRLPPDRLTPAVVRNLLGVELERLFWPDSAAPAAASSVGHQRTFVES
jgi:hypothetical protein